MYTQASTHTRAQIQKHTQKKNSHTHTLALLDLHTLDTSGEGHPGEALPAPWACIAARPASGGTEGVNAESMSDVELTCTHRHWHKHCATHRQTHTCILQVKGFLDDSQK